MKEEVKGGREGKGKKCKGNGKWEVTKEDGRAMEGTGAGRGRATSGCSRAICY